MSYPGSIFYNVRHKRVSLKFLVLVENFLKNRIKETVGADMRLHLKKEWHVRFKQLYLRITKVKLVLIIIYR